MDLKNEAAARTANASAFYLWPLSFLCIATVALLIRYPFLADGHIDEVHTIGRALQIVYTGDLNPHFFKHPTGTMYLCVPMEILALSTLNEADAPPAKTNEPQAPLETFKQKYPNPATQSLFKGRVSPLWDAFIFRTRSLHALLIPLQIFLLAYIGKRTNLLVPALCAGLLLATSGASIRDSCYISVNNTTATFCLIAVCLTAFFASRNPARSLPQWLLRQGAIAYAVGLAVACKYNAGTAIIIPILFGFFTIHQLPDGKRWRIEYSALSLVAITFFLSLGFTTLCPYWFKELPTFVRDVLHQIFYFKVGHRDYNTFTPGIEMAWINLRCMADQYSWTGVTATLASVVYLLLRKVFQRDENRSAALVLVPAAIGCLAFYMLMSNQAVFFARNFSIIWPALFFCSAASWWYASGEIALQRRFRHPKRIQIAVTCAFTLFCVVKANLIDALVFGPSREWWRHNDEIIAALKSWF